MSITVLNYLDQDLVNKITQQAAMRKTAAASPAENADFAASLTESTKLLGSDNNSTNSQTSTAAASGTTVSSPADYEAYFKEASEAYGVSTTILKSIAKAESNFNPSAVSSAGAVGIMQLMPATAASLGVSNSYDARENILGGAKYISQLLSRYQGNISLALAAYNAGCGNVDKYGGIPPFTETQNYVKKVLSYMNGTFSTSDTSTNNSVDTSSNTSGIFGLTGEERDAANEMLGNFFASNNITKSTLDLLVALLKLKNMLSDDTSGTTSGNSTTTPSTDNSSGIPSTDNSSGYPSSATSTPVLPEGTPASVTDTAIPVSDIPSVDPVTPAAEPPAGETDTGEASDDTSATGQATAPTEETENTDTSATGQAAASTGETESTDTPVTPESSTGEPVAAPSMD